MRRMTIHQAQEGFTRIAAGVIVLAALIYTYDGTMTFCQAHGALGWRGAMIAGMNDLTVLVGVLWPERPLQVLAGLCAVFTIWANLSHAEHTAAGYAVAAIAPALAVLLVGALEWIGRRKPPVTPVTVTEVKSPATEPWTERDLTGPLADHAAKVTEIAEAILSEPKPEPKAEPKALPKVRASLAPQQTADEKDRTRWKPREHPLWADWFAAREQGQPWTPEAMAKQMKMRMDRDLTPAAATMQITRWEKVATEQ